MNKYNTTGARIVAAILDGLVLGQLSYIDDLVDDYSHSAFLLIAWTVISMSAFQVYTIILHGRFGQTLGKMAMQIKIVSYPDESPISYRQAFIRELPYTILLVFNLVLTVTLIVNPERSFDPVMKAMAVFPALTGFLWILVEMVTMLFNAKRRAVHDLIAKTVVIKTGKAPGAG